MMRPRNPLGLRSREPPSSAGRIHLRLALKACPRSTLTFSDSPRNRTRYEWLAAKCKEVLGVEIKLNPVESTTYTALTKDINTAPQTFILGWCADYPDPQNWLSVYWKTGAFGERIGYSNPELDALVDQADKGWILPSVWNCTQQAQKLLVDGAPVAFAGTTSTPIWSSRGSRALSQRRRTPFSPASRYRFHHHRPVDDAVSD